MSSQTESMDYVEQCLEDEEQVCFVTYIKRQDIEKSYIFNKYFKKTLAKIVNDKDNNMEVSDKLREWAQDIIDNEYVILDCVDVVEYWTKVETKKFKANLKYQAAAQLCKRAEYEAKIAGDFYKDSDDERYVSRQMLVSAERLLKKSKFGWCLFSVYCYNT